jgi:uncharacterized protein
MIIEDPFHPGELRVQERLGQLDQGRRVGRAIADSILPGAFAFIAQQEMAVLASVGARGELWASVVFGLPGFLRVVDERTVELDLQQASVHGQDPLLANTQLDPRVGLLLIEFETRRRLRINGRVDVHGSELRIAVEESYANCPKYIHSRRISGSPVEAFAGATRAQAGTALGQAQLNLIASVDTGFVASANPTGGLDASHRGGGPGFVKVLNERLLRIPDYPGNRMYNTLGNLVANPRASLCLLDFDSGRLLTVSGHTRIPWMDDGATDLPAERYWELEIDRFLELPMPSGLSWEDLEPSPTSPRASRA